VRYFLAILLFISAAHAGDLDRISIEKIVLTQGINIDSYNSLGFSNIVYAPASEISAANPASLANFSSFATGVRFTYTTKINYTNDTKLSRPEKWLPATVGITFPFRILKLGLAYHRKYSTELDFPPLMLSDSSTISMREGSVIHSPSGILAGSLSGIITDYDKLSLGLQLYWDIWHEYLKPGDNNLEINGNKLSWKIGAVYQMNKILSIGMVFVSATDIEGTIKPDLFAGPDINTNQPNFQQVFINKPVFRLPKILSFGFTSQIRNHLNISLTLSSIFWKSLKKDYKNQLDISFSSIYEFRDRSGISLSLYKADRNIYYGSSSENNITFLGAGIKTGWKNFDGRIEVLDSNFFSSEYQKQTKIRAALDYYL
jgi:hypothetical protein